MKPDEYLVKIQLTNGKIKELTIYANSRDSAIFHAGAHLQNISYYFSNIVSCEKIK